MTTVKPLPAILPGPDGEKAEVFYACVGYYVSDGNWFGVTKSTKRAAIEAWNRVMALVHAAKKGEK